MDAVLHSIGTDANILAEGMHATITTRLEQFWRLAHRSAAWDHSCRLLIFFFVLAMIKP